MTLSSLQCNGEEIDSVLKKVRDVLRVLYSDYYQRIKDTDYYKKNGKDEKERWIRVFVDSFVTFHQESDKHERFSRNPGDFSVPGFDLPTLMKGMNTHWYSNKGKPEFSMTGVYEIPTDKSIKITAQVAVKNGNGDMKKYRNSWAHEDIVKPSHFVDDVKDFIYCLPFERCLELYITSRIALQELHAFGTKFGRLDWEVDSFLSQKVEVMRHHYGDEKIIKIPTSVACSLPMSKKSSESIRITRNTPQLIICLVDESASMGQLVESDPKKRTVGSIVQDSLNGLVKHLYTPCQKGGPAPYNYFYLQMIGYRGTTDGALIEDLFNCKEDAPADIRNAQFRSVPDFFCESCRGDRVKFQAGGTTPMKEAFEKAYEILKTWDADVGSIVQSNATRYPAPIILSITDGIYDNAMVPGEKLDKTLSPEPVINTIRNTEYAHFDTPLIMNIHVSTKDTGSHASFPSEAPQDEYGCELYRFSSTLTADMVDAAKKQGYVVTPESKAMIYYGNPRDLLKILKIGTVAATRISITGSMEKPLPL